MEDSSTDAEAWLPPRRRQAEQQALQGEDLELALRAAERLAAEAGLAGEQESLSRIWAVVATAVILSATALSAGLLGDHVGTFGFRVCLVIATCGLLGALAACWWLILRARYRRKSLYFRLNLAQGIVGMLREVVLDVAERENWSYIRLETTNLRISAFPLGRPNRRPKLDRMP